MPSAKGRHRFGGPCDFKGTVPAGTDVPLQLVLELDLTDKKLPIASKKPIKRLPLLYPFKYGIGGGEVQYSVVSDTKVKILYMSSPKPDAPDYQYLEVDELPLLSLDLVPLTYEEARILAFMGIDGHFRPNKDDRAILKNLEKVSYIPVGGRRDHIPNAGHTRCRNPKCIYNGDYVFFCCLAMVPAIPVGRDTSFWHEYEGGDVHFCFGFCHACGTVIAFNVCS